MIAIKKKVAKVIYKYALLRFLHALYLLVFSPNRITYVKFPSFEGWGMTTTTRTPWENDGNHFLTKSFSEAHNKIKNLVKNNKFILSQFPQMFPGIDQLKFLDELSWRHYIVYWSTVYAIKNTKVDHNNLVECGVCDGLTIYYALSAAESLKKSNNAYLYDAWDAMKEDLLLESEKDLVGQYSYLDMSATEKNLTMFNSESLFFNKGYIPDSFKSAQNPSNLVWLHIDLNASEPTLDALNFFWDDIEEGGVILFDDYALPGYQDTQVRIEKWFSTKSGTLFHMPTGQAIIIKDHFSGKS